jgi:hypothetical protein
MCRRLGFAVALCAAGPVMAYPTRIIATVDNAVVDFENFNVGDVLSFSDRTDHLLTIGTPIPFIGFNGVIEGDESNKYLRLFNEPISDPSREGFARMGLFNRTHGNHQTGGVRVISTTHTIDIYSASGGFVFKAGGRKLSDQIPNGQWMTTAVNFHTDGDSHLDFNGPGASSFLIDNFRYSAVLSYVPESGTWAMMIAGFGLVGGAMRARSRKASLSAV